MGHVYLSRESLFCHRTRRRDGRAQVVECAANTPYQVVLGSQKRCDLRDDSAVNTLLSLEPGVGIITVAWAGPEFGGFYVANDAVGVVGDSGGGVVFLRSDRAGGTEQQSAGRGAV